jgi:hypothetical protein
MKYLSNISKFLILEGGRAFSTTGPINRDQVEPAFNKFKASIATIFGGQTEPELIGSWRQKAVSGDLDALFYSDLSLEEIASRLADAGQEAKIFHGFNIVSTNFEYETGKAVQVDLFVRPKDTSAEMITLFYKSPENEEYSTKHRVFLIFAVLDSMRFGTESDNTGKLIKFNGYMLRPDGLYRFTKQLKRSNYSITDRDFVTSDLDEISKILFGKSVPYSEWNTYAGTLALLKRNPSLNMKEILKSYRQKLTDEGLKIPPSANQSPAQD